MTDLVAFLRARLDEDEAPSPRDIALPFGGQQAPPRAWVATHPEDGEQR